MKEVRKIKKMAVRNMCIENSHYTRGTVDEYDNMFTMCDVKNATTEDIEEIAYDIVVHSDIHELKAKFNCLTCELVSNIMCDIINNCTVTFIE